MAINTFKAASGKTLRWLTEFVTDLKRGMMPWFPKQTILGSPENPEAFAAGRTNRKSKMP